MNRIAAYEIVEMEVGPDLVQLLLRVEADDWTATTEVRAALTGPKNAVTRTAEAEYAFEPVEVEDEEPGFRSFALSIADPALWSPASPSRYEGSLELWEDGQRVDSTPLHYAVYVLSWEEDRVFVNEQPLTLKVREVAALDEAVVRRLRKEGVNVVLLPADQSAAWELADRLGLFLMGMLPSDGALPADLMDRSVRPCCLGWVYSSPESPLPDEPIPGLFGLRSAEPVEALPEGMDFLLLDAPPDLAEGESLGYPWLARRE